MNTIEAILVKAFTKNKEQGNPAGVILNADILTDEQMTAISAQLGFSESAFIQKSDKADFKVRFFTPIQEVNLCGHATIASFHVLVENKAITFNDKDYIRKTIETKVSVLVITCFPNGLIMMNQNNPQFSSPETDRQRIAKLLSLSEKDFLDYPIQSVSTGASKLIIPIKSLSRLFAIKPNLDGIKTYSQEKNIRGFYPFTFETKEKGSDMHTRQFNPLVGINEDPITGVAAGSLGAYIVKHKLLNKNYFIVEQGYIMGKAGKMYVNVEKNDVQVGGYAVINDKKKMVL